MAWIFIYVEIEFVYLHIVITSSSLCFRQGSNVEQFHWLVIPCINIFEIVQQGRHAF